MFDVSILHYNERKIVMKRIVILIAMAICSVVLLTGCGTSIVGEWKCVKAVIDGEESSKSSNYSFTANEDSTGILYKGSKELTFTWKEGNDGYDIEFDKSRLICRAAKIVDDQFVFNITEESGTRDDYKIVLYFEK